MSGLYQKKRKRPEMNLVPLIDVLTMLIFFSFVTMQFKSATTLNITLPKVETAGKNDLKGTVTIAIDKTGAVTFNGKLVSDDELKALLQQVHDLNLNKEVPILIKADEDSHLKKITFVMDTCRGLGMSNFSIETR